MSEKQWSYSEITAAAEKRITELMDRAKTLSGPEGKAIQEWAYGAYLGWTALTMGWQKEGDVERLEALATGGDLPRLDPLATGPKG